MKLWNRLMCYCRRRSPWIFHMNSGSCNGCDIEIVAALSPRYDAEQLGVRLEDTVWVRPDGQIDILAPYPSDLVLPMKV